MKRILSMLESKPIAQGEIEKLAFYAMIYSLAFIAAFQLTAL